MKLKGVKSHVLAANSDHQNETVHYLEISHAVMKVYELYKILSGIVLSKPHLDHINIIQYRQKELGYHVALASNSNRHCLASLAFEILVSISNNYASFPKSTTNLFLKKSKLLLYTLKLNTSTICSWCYRQCLVNYWKQKYYLFFFIKTIHSRSESKYNFLTAYWSMLRFLNEIFLAIFLLLRSFWKVSKSSNSTFDDLFVFRVFVIA